MGYLYVFYINILALEMASRWNQHCANCIGKLSFPVGYLHSRFRYANKNVQISTTLHAHEVPGTRVIQFRSHALAPRIKTSLPLAGPISTQSFLCYIRPPQTNPARGGSCMRPRYSNYATYIQTTAFNTARHECKNSRKLPLHSHTGNYY